MSDESRDLTHHMTDSISGYMESPIGETLKQSHWEIVGILGLVSLVLIFATILIVVFVWSGLRNRRFQRVIHLQRLKRLFSLKRCFLIVWFYGFVVYDVGMCTGQYISLLTNAPMAILYAFKIFIFDSDVSEVHEAFHASWVYSLNFALVHFLAALISTLFLIKLFGFTISQRLKMWYASKRWCSSVSDTYVFWGFNEATRHLIESIKAHYNNTNDNSYRIIVVKSDDENSSSRDESNIISKIFGFLSLPSVELEQLQSLKCFTWITYVNLASINIQRDASDILGATLGMKSLKRLLGNKTKSKIHMLFLSANEESNIHNVNLLRQDATMRQFVKNQSNGKREVKFYCHARRNSVHRAIEDEWVDKYIKIDVVDSSHISVEQLKQDPKLLPVNYVEVGKDARVSSDFNALVVGFSEVGLDSVRFLYEYGAFVREGGNADVADRSGFHIDVVDKNMDDLAGAFVANAPSVRPYMPFVNKEKDADSMIALHKMDCRSVDFYDKLVNWIKSLNYVVIATEDDELNISLGVRIFKLATRYRKDLDKLCILVRAHNDDDGQIHNIAYHYNRIWDAYTLAPEVDGNRINQTKVRKNEEVKMPIHIFGLDIKTYTYDNIIADTLEVRAREYKSLYERTVNPRDKINKNAWDDCYDKYMQLEEPYKTYSPTYFGIMKLRRCQMQDYANSLHEITKSILVDKALEKCGLDRSYFRKLARKKKTMKYVWPRGVEEKAEICAIAYVLGQTEHLRWVASHELIGYLSANQKNEVRLYHDCLKDWSKLDEETRSYDCNVSDILLGVTITDD